MTKPLDPLPYRTVNGRKPLGYVGNGRERVAFNPRPEYEQDREKYFV